MSVCLVGVLARFVVLILACTFTVLVAHRVFGKKLARLISGASIAVVLSVGLVAMAGDCEYLCLLYEYGILDWWTLLAMGCWCTNQPPIVVGG